MGRGTALTSRPSQRDGQRSPAGSDEVVTAQQVRSRRLLGASRHPEQPERERDRAGKPHRQQHPLVARREPSHLEAPVRAARHRADDHGVGKARAPLGILDGRRFGRRRVERRQLERAEQSAALQIRAYDAGDASAERRLAVRACYATKSIRTGAGKAPRASPRRRSSVTAFRPSSP